MILILLLLAVLIGYLRKGRLGNLSGLSIRMVPVLVLAFLLQGGIYLGYAYDITVIQDFDILIHFVSYILLFAALMSNFENKWFVVMTLGMILNFLVIFLNGGRMPVSLDALDAIGLSGSMEALFARRAGTHQPLEEGMFLWFLADVIPIRFPEVARIFSNIYSIGDFFIYAGAVGLVQSAMVGKKESLPELDLDELLDEELLGRPTGESLFQDDVNEEEIARLRALRKKREQETRRIFQDEAAEYFDQGETVILPQESPNEVPPELEVADIDTSSNDILIHPPQEIPSTEEEALPLKEALVSVKEETPPFPEPFDSMEEVPVKEEEPEWKIYTQDFANAALLGGSQLEEQILKGENYTEEDLFRQRKYYTKPLHERMRIDLESDGYDWKTKAEETNTEAASIPNEEVEAGTQKTTEETTPQPVDTTHPFIIVDGRIVENPNYYRGASARKPKSDPLSLPVEEEPISEGTEANRAVEESLHQEPSDTPDMEGLDSKVAQPSPSEPSVSEGRAWTPVAESREEEEQTNPTGNILLKLKDEERIDLMKKMKERKELGYSLVQVKVGDKTITFWKKDL